MSEWLDCAAGCCFHRSDEQFFYAYPPVEKWVETCCNCGQRWKVTSAQVPEEGHGPHAPAPMIYQERREPLQRDDPYRP
jgi:hypothetical protein